MYNEYAKQIIKINTKVNDAEVIKRMTQPILNFVQKHGVQWDLGYDANNDLVSYCTVEGRTSAYCKGMVSEVKQMLKDIFKCKLDVLIYAY